MFDFPDSKLNYYQRHQRRLAYRNEFNLYKTNCALTGKSVISMYKPNSNFPIISAEAWYSSEWDGTNYGQEYDFTRSFFDQFRELQSKVPRLSNITVNCQNSDYCNIIGDCKNCYMIFGSANCENCMYGNPYNSQNCIDNLNINNCQFCYQCIDSEKLYECFYCQNCHSSNNLEYCIDVSSCNNCFLCVGIRQKEYCVFNQQYSIHDYYQKVSELKNYTPDQLQQSLKQFKIQIPVKNLEGINNENVIGDHANNSKNCTNVFNINNCENVNNSTQILNCSNCDHSDYGEYSENVYENSGFYKSYNTAFCHWCWDISNCQYCSICFNGTKNCFGCISLNKKEYCILNKQYTKQDYERLVPKIIEHMKQTGEYGEFFPIQNSPFPYQDSIAELYYPSTQDQNSNKDFIITSQEKSFYQKYKLPEPILDPISRYKNRIQKRNPRVFYHRTCSKCQKQIQTTYSPTQPEIVYCEDCYLQAVY